MAVIGLGTYTFFWQHSDKSPEPMGLPEMLCQTRDWGGEVFQICDYVPLLGYSTEKLRDLRRQADELGLTLELGTKGIAPDHLRMFLRFSEQLGARIVRSMLNTPDHRPTMSEARECLAQVLPDYEAAGVVLALETYEQVSSVDLVALIQGLGSPGLGVCLDPANCVAGLEHPNAVVDRCAPYVANIHVKDFAFTRRGGWVGFTLEGAELGTGLLDYDYLVKTVRPESRGINRIIEHWLPWQGSFEETRRLENLWTTRNLAYLRKHVS